MNRFKELRYWLKHALWFVPFAYLVNFIYAVHSDQSGGTFGDTFGAANALFSGTALLMLVLAVSLQREELEEVREERNDTRKLLEGQEELTELQKDALNRQIFQQTFGSLLDSALQEKNRLAIKPVVENKQKPSEYFNSSLFSARLLQKAARTAEIQSILPDSSNQLAKKNYTYVCLVVHIAQLVESNGADRDTMNLVRSLFDDECCHCMAWYIVEATILNQDTSRFVHVFKALNLVEQLGGEPREGFLRVWADIS